MRDLPLWHRLALALGLGLALGPSTWAAAGTAQAGELRDPMRPPAAAMPRTPGTATTTPEPPTVRQLLWVNGQRFVVDGSRRRTVGDWLGDARIEDIEDTAVVVRRNGQTQRLPLFAGVTKRPVADPASASAIAASSAPLAMRRPLTQPKVRVAAAPNPDR